MFYTEIINYITTPRVQKTKVLEPLFWAVLGLLFWTFLGARCKKITPRTKSTVCQFLMLLRNEFNDFLENLEIEILHVFDFSSRKVRSNYYNTNSFKKFLISKSRTDTKIIKLHQANLESVERVLEHSVMISLPVFLINECLTKFHLWTALQFQSPNLATTSWQALRYTIYILMDVKRI